MLLSIAFKHPYELVEHSGNALKNGLDMFK